MIYTNALMVSIKREDIYMKMFEYVRVQRSERWVMRCIEYLGVGVTDLGVGVTLPGTSISVSYDKVFIYKSRSIQHDILKHC